MVKTIFLIISFMVIGCKEKQEVQQPYQEKKDEFIEISKNRQKEKISQEISFIENWMKETHQTGYTHMPLGYWIKWEIQNKSGGTAQPTNIVEYEMEIKDLRNSIIYSFDEIQKKYLVLEKNPELRGVEDALKHMSEGDQCELILPSFLAYGIYGDGKKIKNEEPLIIRLKVNEIKPFKK